MATHKITFDAPSPVTTNICNDFEAQMGAKVTFTGVVGSQTISAIPGQTWPFSLASPISLPRPGQSYVYILSSGLTPGDTYNFNVSQTCANEATKGVTIIDGTMPEHRHE
jgi:hypothetical protein